MSLLKSFMEATKRNPIPNRKTPAELDELKRQRREAIDRIDRLDPVERELFLLYAAQRRALNTLVKQSRKLSRVMRGLFQGIKL